MSGVITNNPTTWNVEGNLIPVEVSNPTGTEPFTENNCTVTLETAVTVDGNLLIPVKTVTDW
jgi:hypothetical protein